MSRHPHLYGRRAAGFQARHRVPGPRRSPSHRRSAATVLLLGCLAGVAGCGPAGEPKASAAGPRFYEVGAAAGLTAANVSGGPEQTYILETMSAGAAFADVDGDGYQDLFLVNGTRHDTVPPAGAHHRLYRNAPLPEGRDGLTRRFVDVSAEAGVDDRGWGMGAAAGDVDNDGDVDLLATHWGDDRFYRNRGDATFTQVATEVGLADSGWGSSAVFADLDNDGDLDLYETRYLHFDLAHPPGGKGRNCHYKGLQVFCGPKFVPPMSDRLYRNDGDGIYTDVSVATGIAAVELPALGVACTDIDADGDLDIYVANDSEPNLLYRNDGDWHLVDIGYEQGVAFTEDGRAQAGMGVHSGDYDDDGDLDLFVTNFSDDTNTMYRRQEDGFAEVTHAIGVGGTARPFLGWGTAFLDADNDGDLDLFVANGQLYPQLDQHPGGLRYRQPNLLYRNDGGMFERVDGGPGLRPEASSRAVAVADIDNDGDPDLLVVNLNEAPSLLLNAGGADNAWLGLQLVGAARAAGTGGANRDAIGARVTVYAGGGAQVREVARGYGFQAAHDPRLRIGLGAATHVDSVRIRWPSGGTRLLSRQELPLRRYVRVTEGGPALALAPVTPSPYRRADVSAAVKQGGSAVREAPADYQLPAGVVTAAGAYAVGQDLYEEGRYREAQAAFTAALELEPEDLPSRVNLAVTLFMGLGQRAAAATELRRALADHPRRYEPHLWLGKLELHGGDLDTALVHLHQAVGLNPLDWDSYHWLGIALLRVDSLEVARVALERSVRLGPYHPRPHLALARALHRLGREDEAAKRRQVFRRLSALQARVQEYEARVETEPRDVKSLTNLGSAYAEQRRFEEARRRFEEALAIQPSYARAHYGLGVLYHQQERPTEAIAAFRAACDADSGFVEAYNGLGQAYHQSGDYGRAVAAYEHAIGLRPDLALLRANLGLAEYARGRPEAALAAWREGLRLAPEDGRLRGWVARVDAELAAR